jgi:polysaccharide export outer membrane protein
MTFAEAKAAIDQQIGLTNDATTTSDTSKYADRLQRLRRLADTTPTMPAAPEISVPTETVAAAAYAQPAPIPDTVTSRPTVANRILQPIQARLPFQSARSAADAPTRPENVVRLSKGRSAPMTASAPQTSAKPAAQPELLRTSAVDTPNPSTANTPAPAAIHLGKGRLLTLPPSDVAPGPIVPPAPHECATVSLPPYVIHPPDILLIESTRSLRDQPIRGQHLVRPDGTIGLGIYGSAYVAGMTLEQARDVVAHEISKRVQDFDARDLSVDVLAYNSKVYYVITDGGGFGEQVYRLPITGHETVLDALAQINGLPPVASKSHIWVARACSAASCGQMILPVDWKGIACDGLPDTNYQIFPGDRVYVKADKMITVDSYLAKVLSPIERLMGTTLLGATTYNSITGRGFGFQ